MAGVMRNGKMFRHLRRSLIAALIILCLPTASAWAAASTQVLTVALPQFQSSPDIESRAAAAAVSWSVHRSLMESPDVFVVEPGKLLKLMPPGSSAEAISPETAAGRKELARLGVEYAVAGEVTPGKRIRVSLYKTADSSPFWSENRKIATYDKIGPALQELLSLMFRAMGIEAPVKHINRRWFQSKDAVIVFGKGLLSSSGAVKADMGFNPFFLAKVNEPDVSDSYVMLLGSAGDYRTGMSLLSEALNHDPGSDYVKSLLWANELRFKGDFAARQYFEKIGDRYKSSVIFIELAISVYKGINIVNYKENIDLLSELSRYSSLMMVSLYYRNFIEYENTVFGRVDDGVIVAYLEAVSKICTYCVAYHAGAEVVYPYLQNTNRLEYLRRFVEKELYDIEALGFNDVPRFARQIVNLYELERELGVSDGSGVLQRMVGYLAAANNKSVRNIFIADMVDREEPFDAADEVLFPIIRDSADAEWVRLVQHRVSINSIGRRMSVAGLCDKAALVFDEAVSASGRAVDEGAMNLATSVVKCYLQNKKMAESKFFTLKTMGYAKEIYGERSVELADHIYDLAEMFYIFNKSIEANGLFLQALDIYVGSKEFESHLLSMRYRIAEKMIGAKVYREVVKSVPQLIDEIGKSSGFDAASKMLMKSQLSVGLCVSYIGMSRYLDAELCLKDFIAFANDVPEEVPDLVKGRLQEAVVQVRRHLAFLLGEKGDFIGAEAMYMTALGLQENGEKLSGFDQYIVYKEIGMLYLKYGNFKKSNEYYQLALSGFFGEAYPDWSAVSDTYSGLASLYQSQGDEIKAREYRKQALVAIDKYRSEFSGEEVDLLYANALSNVGAYDGDESALKTALNIRERILGPDHPDVAITLGNLASHYDEMGRLEEAKKLAVRSLSIKKAAFKSDNGSTLIASNNLAAYLIDEHRYQEALPLIEEAVAMAIRLGRPDLQFSTFNNAFMFYTFRRQPEMAVFYGKLAVNAVQSMRGQLAFDSREAQKKFIQDKAYLYRNLATVLGEAGRIDEAQQVLTMMKEEEYFDFIRRDAGSGDPRTTVAGLAVIEAEAVERITLAAKGPVDEFQAVLASMTAALESSKGRDAAQMSAKRIQVDADLPNTHPELFEDQGVALLQYVVDKADLSIFATTAKGKLARTIKVRAEDVNAKVLALRAALTDRRVDPVPPARALYDLLLAPIAEDLEKAGVKMLLVSSDGILRYIPFATLHDGKGWLVERYPVAMLNEAAKPNLSTPPNKSWKVAGFGVSEGVGGLNPLPAVKEELDSIVKPKDGEGRGILPGTRALNKNFTGAALRQAVEERYPVLHIATHFVFTQYVDSYLLLGDGGKIHLSQISGGNDEDKNGYTFNLVDLLALSACDTGKIGTDASGREVEGLGVAVQKAGARSVLASLWKVADGSTSLLMRRFYRERVSNPALGKAEALRQAQLSMIAGRDLEVDESDKVERGALPQGYVADAAPTSSYIADPARPYAHPNFWAPFILMGNWL